MKKGFTLIELMILISIVGILLGVTIPIFQDSIAKHSLKKQHYDISDWKAFSEKCNNGEYKRNEEDYKKFHNKITVKTETVNVDYVVPEGFVVEKIEDGKIYMKGKDSYGRDSVKVIYTK